MNRLYPGARVLRHTKNEADWHAARRLGIGGSDASVILGTSGYKTIEQLLELKLGLLEPEPAGLLARCGTLLEDAVLERAFDGLAHPGAKLGTLQSVEHPHLIANIDGVLVEDDRVTLIEVKTSGRPWRSGRIPAYYVDQVQHYLLVTGLEQAIVVCCELHDERETLARCMDMAGANPDRIVAHMSKLVHYPLTASLAWQRQYIPRAAAFWAKVKDRDV